VVLLDFDVLLLLEELVGPGLVDGARLGTKLGDPDGWGLSDGEELGTRLGAPDGWGLLDGAGLFLLLLLELLVVVVVLADLGLLGFSLRSDLLDFDVLLLLEELVGPGLVDGARLGSKLGDPDGWGLSDGEELGTKLGAPDGWGLLDGAGLFLPLLLLLLEVAEVAEVAELNLGFLGFSLRSMILPYK
jgi:hypothetical protein